MYQFVPEKGPCYFLQVAIYKWEGKEETLHELPAAF